MRIVQIKLSIFLILSAQCLYAENINTHIDSPVSIQSIDNKIAHSEGDIKKRFIAWKRIILKNQNLPLQDKLKNINDFFNMFEYESESETVYQGKADYWKTPNEFVEDGGGDCEDFAISKYFTLLLLQVPIERLRITYVKASNRNTAHMILAYYETPKSEPLILDNLTAAILPSSKRPDLVPVYSFNGNNLWLAKTKGDEDLGNSSQLSKWQALIERMKTKDKQ